MFATAESVVASVEEPRGKRIALFLDNNAAAGALIRAPSAVAVVPMLIGRSRASCWVERVPLDANPADAPGRKRPLSLKPSVTGEIAPLHMALRLCACSANQLFSLNAVDVRVVAAEV